jgi:hypothetical protein
MQRTATTHVKVLVTLILFAATMLVPALGRASPAAAAASIDMADLFLVDQNGNWFCDDTGANAVKGTRCGSDGRRPRAAADALLRRMKGNQRHLYLRVAKARDECDAVQEGPCLTGVPAYKPCADSPNGPWCTLRHLRKRGIKLGVILGAGDDDGKPRSVADLARHACRISQADTTRLYDFMFLDFTVGLATAELKAAIGMIRKGQDESGKPCPDVRGQRRRWSKIIVNATSAWNPNDATSLHLGAWAYAKRLDVLGTSAIESIGDGDAAALTAEDELFLQQVNATGHRAVLRLEVPKQTSTFAGLGRAQQCSLLTRWASLQQERRFTLIYPLYVHGIQGAAPYDSFGQRTFGLQSALIDRYPSRRGTQGLPGCGTDDDGDSADKVPEPGDEAPPEEPPAPPPPPVLRLAGAGAQEPTEVTCRSARLHGWVNPHANATRFGFEYWENGVNVPQPAGGGDAGAGTDRNLVSRVAEGLRPDTHYSARLIAVNAAGQSASEVVSFTTRRRC